MSKQYWTVWFDPEYNCVTLCHSHTDHHGSEASWILGTFITEAYTDEEHFEQAKQKEKGYLCW